MMQKLSVFVLTGMVSAATPYASMSRSVSANVCEDVCCDCGYPKGIGCDLGWNFEDYSTTVCISGPCWWCFREEVADEYVSADELAKAIEAASGDDLARLVQVVPNRFVLNAERRLLGIEEERCGMKSLHVMVRISNEDANVIANLGLRSLTAYVADSNALGVQLTSAAAQ